MNATRSSCQSLRHRGSRMNLYKRSISLTLSDGITLWSVAVSRLQGFPSRFKFQMPTVEIFLEYKLYWLPSFSVWLPHALVGIPLLSKSTTWNQSLTLCLFWATSRLAYFWLLSSTPVFLTSMCSILINLVYANFYLVLQVPTHSKYLCCPTAHELDVSFAVVERLWLQETHCVKLDEWLKLLQILVMMPVKWGYWIISWRWFRTLVLLWVISER